MKEDQRKTRYYQFVVQWNAGEPFVTPDWSLIGLPCPEYGREGECFKLTGENGLLVLDQAYCMLVEMAILHRRAIWRVLERITGEHGVTEIGEVSIHHRAPFTTPPEPCPHRRRRTDQIDS